MTKSPAGRRPRTGSRTTDQWLELPGWRRPVDTLLVLGATVATVWMGLAVLPAAAHSVGAAIENWYTHMDQYTSPPAAGPAQDPGAWIAGPAYPGGPGGPAGQQPLARLEVIGEATRSPAPHVARQHPATHAASRTTPRKTSESKPRTTPGAHASTMHAGTLLAAAELPATTTAPPATTADPTTSETTPTTTTPTTTTSDPATTTSDPATPTSDPATTTDPGTTTTDPGTTTTDPGTTTTDPATTSSEAPPTP